MKALENYRLLQRYVDLDRFTIHFMKLDITERRLKIRNTLIKRSVNLHNILIKKMGG